MSFKTISIIMILMLSALAVSCGDDDLPEDILKENEMVQILLDMYIAEGKVSELKVKRDSALIIFDVYEDKILDTYALTDSIYTNSLRYYYDHPLKLESIYETVLDSLTLLEKRLDELKKENEDAIEENKEDSINVEPSKLVGS
ncbi:MAG: DUF4296 domain-containing protein [Bacteroidota bacterium]